MAGGRWPVQVAGQCVAPTYLCAPEPGRRAGPPPPPPAPRGPRVCWEAATDNGRSGKGYVIEL